VIQSVGFPDGEMDMKMTQAQPEVDERRCTRCGLCVEACSCDAVKVGDHGPVFTCPEAEPRAEAGCSCLCEEVCPTGAISWPFQIVLDADANGRSSAAEQSGTDSSTGPASTFAQTAGGGGGRKEREC
jgi:formate hydrogenlyase subunit 6/NADH:ubiquinone oxidoreductase subunit I